MPAHLPPEQHLDRQPEPGPDWPNLGPGGATACPAAPIEHHSQVCPTCSERLLGHRCKLVCPRCGYYLSCSDYY